MTFRNGLAAAMALACALAAGVGAADAQTATTVQSLDANHAPLPIAGQRDASGGFHYRDLMEGVSSSGAPDALLTDGSGHLAALPLPTGAATQATLQQLITALGAPLQAGGVIGNTSFGISGTLPAFASPPTVNLGSLNGGATAASQATANGYLASLAGTVLGQSLSVTCASGCAGGGSVPTGSAGAPNAAVLTVQGVASGRPLIVDGSTVTQPISAASLPLPSGAATASGVSAIVAALGSPFQAGGSVAVASSALPAGASTASAQATGNASLATLAGTVTAGSVSVTCASGCAGGGGSVPTGTAGSPNAAVLTVQGVASGRPLIVDGSAVTQPISASALPLPSGAATASGVAAVVTALGTPLQAGGSVAVTSSALPTGAATAAAQASMLAAESSNIVFAAQTTPLSSGATLPLIARDAGAAVSTGVAVSYFNATFYADQAGTASIDLSDDGTNWTPAVAGTALTASTPLTLTAPLLARYYRAHLVNGSTAETTLRVSTAFSRN